VAEGQETVIVALLTDFGLEDVFVASCHGVIAKLAPEVRVLDVTHLVPAGDVRRGAALLAQVIPHLPPAVVVGVVDPGVGTQRRAVAVQAGEHVLVGPDNGLLGWAASAAGGARAAYRLGDPSAGTSATFHGRDVFAPAAARLAGGTPVGRLGREIGLDSLVRLPEPVHQVGAGHVEAEVLTVDRYGNLQTCLPPEPAARAGLRPGTEVQVACGGHTLRARYGSTFGSVPAGEPVVFVDSAGLLAVAVNQGDAARELSAGAGSLLRLTAGGR
jgi:S-adenosyl-L-methionine hydrolase (adenosine-forming)